VFEPASTHRASGQDENCPERASWYAQAAIVTPADIKKWGFLGIDLHDSPDIAGARSQATTTGAATVRVDLDVNLASQCCASVHHSINQDFVRFHGPITLKLQGPHDHTFS